MYPNNKTLKGGKQLFFDKDKTLCIILTKIETVGRHAVDNFKRNVFVYVCVCVSLIRIFVIIIIVIII